MSDAKDVVRRLEQAWAANDLTVVDELLAPDLVSHDAPPGMPPGREGARAAHGMAMTSFPDRKMTIEDVIGDGGRVAEHWGQNDVGRLMMQLGVGAPAEATSG